MINAFRIDITDRQGAVIVPALKRKASEKKMVIKNVSTGLIPPSVRISFSGDDVKSYWTLGPNEISPIISGLKGGDSFFAYGVGGASVIEVMVWDS